MYSNISALSLYPQKVVVGLGADILCEDVNVNYPIGEVSKSSKSIDKLFINNIE